MMLRNGFVSNSSSSSFVVLYKFHGVGNREPKSMLTNAQVVKLMDIGFRFVANSDPAMPAQEKELEAFHSHENVYLRQDIVCNQDETTLFLLENGVPFLASVHYDEETIVWDGKSDFFVEITNPNMQVVRQLQLAGEIPLDIQKPLKKYNVQEFIARELKYRNQ